MKENPDKKKIYDIANCVKREQIQSFFWSVFEHFPRRGNLASQPICQASFSLKHCKWLMVHIAFHNPDTIRQAFLNEIFASMR